MPKSTKPFSKVLTCAAITFLLVCVSNAQAQEKNPKYEFGIHYAALNISEKSDTDGGLGLRSLTTSTTTWVSKLKKPTFRTGVKGAKAMKGKDYLVCAPENAQHAMAYLRKVRPGFTRFYSLGRPGLNFFEQDRTRFTVDVGGVFEYYPHRNVAIRVDAGDTRSTSKQEISFGKTLIECLSKKG